MKSAYEIALEKMADQGIEAPSDTSLSEESRNKIAAARQKAAAALAELEILHRDRLKGLTDPVAVQEEKENYLRERGLIESRRDRDIKNARQQS